MTIVEPRSWSYSSNLGKDVDAEIPAFPTPKSLPSHPITCTFLGELQAQLEFLTQPLSLAIDESCGEDQGETKLPHCSAFPWDPPRESGARPPRQGMWDLNASLISKVWEKNDCEGSEHNIETRVPSTPSQAPALGGHTAHSVAREGQAQLQLRRPAQVSNGRPPWVTPCQSASAELRSGQERTPSCISSS